MSISGAITGGVTWMGSGADGREHVVSDEENLRAITADEARVALCGHPVLGVSLAAEPGPVCRGCAELMRRPVRPSGRENTGRQKRGGLARLWGRLAASRS